MKKYLNYIHIFLFLGLMPALVSAAVENIFDVIGIVGDILAAILPLIMTLAVVYFLWSTAQYIREEGDKKNEARSHMIWGIVILFVMISVWGLVNILTETFFF